jgi:hypothetical protein
MQAALATKSPGCTTGVRGGPLALAPPRPRLGKGRTLSASAGTHVTILVARQHARLVRGRPNACLTLLRRNLPRLCGIDTHGAFRARRRLDNSVAVMNVGLNLVRAVADWRAREITLDSRKTGATPQFEVSGEYHEKADGTVTHEESCGRPIDHGAGASLRGRSRGLSAVRGRSVLGLALAGHSGHRR